MINGGEHPRHEHKPEGQPEPQSATKFGKGMIAASLSFSATPG